MKTECLPKKSKRWIDLHLISYLRICNWSQFLVAQLLNGCLVISQIELCADQNNGCARTVMAHLWIPLNTTIYIDIYIQKITNKINLKKTKFTYLGSNVLKRSWIHQRKAYEKNVRLRIGQRSKTIVVLLTGRVPQSQIDWFAIDHHVRRVIVKSLWKKFRIIDYCLMIYVL